MNNHNPTNSQIAEMLEHAADQLEVQAPEANRYRTRAYRRAARAIREHPESVARLARRGREAVMTVPQVGSGIAGAVEEYVTANRMGILERLESERSPEDAFAQVPGVGPTLSRRIYRELGIETLEELEIAAHDGRLEDVPGVGARRAETIRESLGTLLSRSARRRLQQVERAVAKGPQAERGRLPQEPPVDMVLAVDQEYRNKAEAGALRTIAPRRFNPEGESWLPIYHTQRGDWSFTAMFSNTARAHEQHKTNDWVVLYYTQDTEEDQCTIVTQERGPLRGLRVIRGREPECRAFYETHQLAH
jgi:hypothetical protein